MTGEANRAEEKNLMQSEVVFVQSQFQSPYEATK